MSKRSNTLDLGPDIIQLLLPHRAPLALVERVHSYSTEPRPALTAAKHISANEPVFAGHFPGFQLWPGVYTIEGLGQSCALLLTIAEMDKRWRAREGNDTSVVDALRNLELGYKLHAGYRAAQSIPLRELLEHRSHTHQLMGALDIKLKKPVFAGQMLNYEVTMVHRHGDAARFNVTATVGQDVAAEGTITGFSGPMSPRASSVS